MSKFVGRSREILLLAVMMWMSVLAQAQPIAREPMHGYWVGYAANTAQTVNTLFPDWYSAAVAQCGGPEFVHPSTTPPTTPTAPANLYCYRYPVKSSSYHYIGGAYYSDACPETTSPQTHDPNRKCYVAGEKPPCECDRHGNPVSFSAKAKIQVEEDYASAHGLKFVRNYNSSQVNPRADAMALGWRHTYSRRLKATFGPSTTATTHDGLADGTYVLLGGSWYPRALKASGQSHFVEIYTPEGYGYRFATSDGGQTFTADADVVVRLTISARDAANEPAEWQLTDEDGNVQTFDAQGRFIAYLSRYGDGYTLNYSDAATPTTIAPKPGLLIGVQDNYGHTLGFAYDAQGRMSKLIDAAQVEYLYSYDANGMLSSVTYPDGLSRNYHYDEPAHNPLYNHVIYKGLLTGISDEVSSGNVQRFSTYKYSERRPVSTEHAGGVEKYSFDYSNSEVVDPLGTRRLYSYGWNSMGRMALNAVGQPRPGSSERDYVQLYYDTAGNLTRKRDRNGAYSCSQYEPGRNLETARIEGATQSNCPNYLTSTSLLAGMRKTTTVWHSTLRQPVTSVQSNLREDWTYDSAGRVLSYTQRATTDGNGALGLAAALVGPSRVTTYTYDSQGKLLTQQGPRTDVASLTSNTYDAAGNLVQVSNPAGQVSVLSNYDAHGRPGRFTDPNGLVTDISYTWRGLPSSVSVGGETTTYTYDGAGRLIRTDLPGGDTLSYTRDAAGRVTAISDGAGNSISYTLDNAGHRLGEQVRDSGGMLARQVGRTFDVLGRLKTVTGAAQ